MRDVLRIAPSVYTLINDYCSGNIRERRGQNDNKALYNATSIEPKLQTIQSEFSSILISEAEYVRSTNLNKKTDMPTVFILGISIAKS